ncbi:hypothetical protein L3X38_018754 [Prunus dulcis]|uniref:Uncharacterized protein n=1 Tax=Prunus dulcis TaxID=3755 RepID=A0AAD4WCB1_PRUDU|nr:hypothetical protein L3X38_018754 [Prunus dulcis]
MNRADPASKRLAPRQPRLLPCRRKTHFRGRADPASKRLAPRQPRLLPCRRKTHFRGARHLPKLPNAKPNLQDTCRHHNGLHKVPHWNFVQSSHFHLPINREQYPGKNKNYSTTFTITLPELLPVTDLGIGEPSAGTTPVSKA